MMLQNFYIISNDNKIKLEDDVWIINIIFKIRNIIDKNNSSKMLDPLVMQSKPIFCFRHKKEIATHLCTDIKCNNNPILCSQCISEGINRNYHYDHHEKNVLPLSEAIQLICETIKNQSSPIQRIYKSTLGRGDFSGISAQLEKGPSLIQQLQSRITTIKGQVQLELELLVKQFQKILLIEKQEYFKLLQNYQKTFVKNIQYLRQQTQPMIDFQNSIKYYVNKNNFYLKMASQINRKSDWIIKTKKSLLSTGKNIQNSSFASDLNSLLGLSNKIKLDIWPTWKGQDTMQKSNQLKFVIKRAINQWAFIPQLKSLQFELQNIPQTSQGSNNMIKNYYLQGQQTNSNSK